MKTQIQKQIEEALKEFDKEFVIYVYVDEDGFDGEFIYNGCPAGDIKKWFKKYANFIATKSAENTTREIIDAYKKNTGIDDDLFIQFLEVMYDHHKEQQ